MVRLLHLSASGVRCLCLGLHHEPLVEHELVVCPLLRRNSDDDLHHTLLDGVTGLLKGHYPQSPFAPLPTRACIEGKLVVLSPKGPSHQNLIATFFMMGNIDRKGYTYNHTNEHER